MSEVPAITDPWVHRFEELVNLLARLKVDEPEKKAANLAWLKNNIYRYSDRLGHDGLRRALSLIDQVHH